MYVKQRQPIQPGHYPRGIVKYNLTRMRQTGLYWKEISALCLEHSNSVIPSQYPLPTNEKKKILSQTNQNLSLK